VSGSSDLPVVGSGGGGAATPPAAPSEPGPVRLVASLAIAGLLSGLVLVGVYLSTEPRIARNRAEALRRAVFQVLPGTATIETWVLDDAGAPAPYAGDGDRLPDGEAIYAGLRDDGSLVGLAVPAEGSGFMDTIRLIYGFDPSRRVIVGMAVLDSRETPGLGDKIIYDPAFLANFEALAVSPTIVAVKDGREAPNEVDCITGATISSEAVVSILNQSTARWIPRIEALLETREVETVVRRRDP
jgi:electron transport complex protein RnfG